MENIAVPQASRLNHTLRAHHKAKEILVQYVHSVFADHFLDEHGRWPGRTRLVMLTERKIFEDRKLGPYHALDMANDEAALNDTMRRTFDAWHKEAYGVMFIGGHTTVAGVTLVDMFSMVDMMHRVVVLGAASSESGGMESLNHKFVVTRLLPLLDTQLWVPSGLQRPLDDWDEALDVCEKIVLRHPFYNHANPEFAQWALDLAAEHHQKFLKLFGAPLVVAPSADIAKGAKEIMGTNVKLPPTPTLAAVSHPTAGMSFNPSLVGLVRFLEGDAEKFSEAADLIQHHLHDDWSQYPEFLDVLAQTHGAALNKHMSQFTDGQFDDLDSLLEEIRGYHAYFKEPRWLIAPMAFWDRHEVFKRIILWRKALAARGPLKFGTMRPKRDRKKKKGKAKKRR